MAKLEELKVGQIIYARIADCEYSGVVTEIDPNKLYKVRALRLAGDRSDRTGHLLFKPEEVTVLF